MKKTFFLINISSLCLILNIFAAGSLVSLQAGAAETVKVAAIFGKTSEGDAMSFINENSSFKGVRYAVNELNQHL